MMPAGPSQQSQTAVNSSTLPLILPTCLNLCLQQAAQEQSGTQSQDLLGSFDNLLDDAEVLAVQNFVISKQKIQNVSLFPQDGNFDHHVHYPIS